MLLYIIIVYISYTSLSIIYMASRLNENRRDDDFYRRGKKKKRAYAHRA